jgi:hypothetical protein
MKRGRNSQRLCICAEPCKAQKELVVNLVDLLVVSCQRLELHAKAQVAADGDTLFASHGYDGCAIILENLHMTKTQKTLV